MFVHDDYVPPVEMAFQWSYRAPRATRTGRTTTARRARRSRSNSSKASPDGSSSDGEPHPGRPRAGARSELTSGGWWCQVSAARHIQKVLELGEVMLEKLEAGDTYWLSDDIEQVQAEATAALTLLEKAA
jgi:hypothetical protein